MSIVDSAKAYLEDSPSAWLNMVNILATKLSVWASSQLGDGGEDIQRGFANFLLTELLSPELVVITAGCSDEHKAQEFITHRLSYIFMEHSIEYGNRNENYDDEIVDFTSDIPLDGIVVTRASDLEGEYDDSEPLLSSFNTQELFFEETELTDVISNALHTLEGTMENNVGSIFRLDIVDVALYKALVQHPELLRSLDWRTFEKLLANILESFGYEVELQRGTKDGGVDLFAVKRVDVFGAQRFLLQAKRYSNKVGVEPVRQLAFLHSHFRATKSCLATTATFTRGAWELAQQYQWQLELRDFDGLHEWIKHAATQYLRRHDT
jgi:HJR/Mrr/RecB family endonuclease